METLSKESNFQPRLEYLGGNRQHRLFLPSMQGRSDMRTTLLLLGFPMSINISGLPDSGPKAFFASRHAVQTTPEFLNPGMALHLVLLEPSLRQRPLVLACVHTSLSPTRVHAFHRSSKHTHTERHTCAHAHTAWHTHASTHARAHTITHTYTYACTNFHTHTRA